MITPFIIKPKRTSQSPYKEKEFVDQNMQDLEVSNINSISVIQMQVDDSSPPIRLKNSTTTIKPDTVIDAMQVI